MFVSFEMIHCFLREDLKNDADKPTLKPQLSYLPNSYLQNYEPLRSTLAKHRILKKLRNDKEIVILRPDKGGGILVLNRRDYEKSTKNVINDQTKFKSLLEDAIIKRESKLQRFLRKLKKNVWTMQNMEKFIQVILLLLKYMGHLKSINFLILTLFLTFVLFFLPSVLTIQLQSFTIALLSPNLLNEFCTKDTFTFVEELKKVSMINF